MCGSAVVVRRSLSMPMSHRASRRLGGEGGRKVNEREAAYNERKDRGRKTKTTGEDSKAVKGRAEPALVAEDIVAHLEKKYSRCEKVKVKCQFIHDIHSVRVCIICVCVCVSPSVHQNYVGTDAEKNPFYLSVVLSDQNNQRVPQYRAILWRKTVSSPSAYLTALLGCEKESHTRMCTVLWSCRVVATLKVTDGVIGFIFSCLEGIRLPGNNERCMKKEKTKLGCTKASSWSLWTLMDPFFGSS